MASDPEILASPLSVQADVVRTKYDTIFDATPFGPTGASVAFTSSFATQLKRAIVDSDNTDAGNVVRALGYSFLNGALNQGGFFNATTKSGVWLAETFDSGLPGAWPSARISSVNDGMVAQAMTCVDMAKMCALMDSGLLVDSAASGEMLDLLKRAQAGPDPSFLTRAEVLGVGVTVSYGVTHAKIGLGPLKPVNGGFDVASEATFVTHKPNRINRIVLEEYARFEGKPIRDFVPLFVERHAKEELSKLGAADRPRREIVLEGLWVFDRSHPTHPRLCGSCDVHGTTPWTALLWTCVSPPLQWTTDSFWSAPTRPPCGALNSTSKPWSARSTKGSSS